ncbi:MULTISPECIES: SPW repeat protein [unclassified Streptomyces]|uniref:SPW repeat protein n=1 Tax=unclassified Streptomyces TaxID=2593676 RepID=UPI002E2D271D|nr:SPW repeat protein [Streptomyces sp. NBC_01429]
MADVSHHRETGQDLSSHPDVPEMRERYARMVGGGRGLTAMAGPVFLVGLFCALSPWIIHFTSSQPALATHNLIMGVALAVLALGLSFAPGRMTGLSPAICAMGIWMIVAPWIVGSGPDKGIIWTNAVIGGLTFLLGLACAGMAMRNSRRSVRRAA